MTTSNFEPTTLVEILRRRVLHQPDRLAYTFLLDGETEEARQDLAPVPCHCQGCSTGGGAYVLRTPPCS